MNRETVREPVTVRSILVPAAVGIVTGTVVFILRGGLAAEDGKALWFAVCDALAVPGLMLTCAGLLTLVSGQGAFDGMSFTARKAFGQILPEARRNAMPKTYYDYVSQRREKQRKKRKTVLYVGLVFLLLAVAALVMYSRYDPLL